MTGRVGNAKRLTHEVFFALNLSLLFCAIISVFSWSSVIMRPFLKAESFRNQVLNIRATDLVGGYFSMCIMIISVGAVIWLLLRIFSKAKIVTQFLRAGAGIAVLLLPALLWIWTYVHVGWPYTWPLKGFPFELLGAIVCLVLYLLRPKAVPTSVWIALLIGHCLFWWWIFGLGKDSPTFAGPVGPILVFLSLLAWGSYAQAGMPAPGGTVSCPGKSGRPEEPVGDGSRKTLYTNKRDY